MILSSFSKINLGLKIGRLREDFFHEVSMVVAFTSLRDVIEISQIKEHKIDFFCDKFICKTEDNLAYKACKIIFDNYEISGGVQVKIAKKIPDGAGLGGGSSNAAAVLFGLNKIFSLNIPSEKLMHFALKIGSDVPMFLSSGILKCSGRGEILTKISSKFPKCKILIKKSEYKINTKDAYAMFNKIKHNDFNNKKIDILEKSIKSGDLSDISDNCFNDFEKITKIPKEWHLTGSGSASFKLVDESYKSDDENVIECRLVESGVKIENFRD